MVYSHVWPLSINQSINQSNFYSANIPGVARLSGARSKSVLNSKIDEAAPQRQQVIGHESVYGGKARLKRYVLRHFLKVETEVDKRTDTGQLFQREGAQELNDLFQCICLDHRYKVIPLFALSERDGNGVASMECRQFGHGCRRIN